MTWKSLDLNDSSATEQDVADATQAQIDHAGTLLPALHPNDGLIDILLSRFLKLVPRDANGELPTPTANGQWGVQNEHLYRSKVVLEADTPATGTEADFTSTDDADYQGVHRGYPIAQSNLVAGDVGKWFYSRLHHQFYHVVDPAGLFTGVRWQLTGANVVLPSGAVWLGEHNFVQGLYDAIEALTDTYDSTGTYIGYVADGGKLHKVTSFTAAVNVQDFNEWIRIGADEAEDIEELREEIGLHRFISTQVTRSANTYTLTDDNLDNFVENNIYIFKSQAQNTGEVFVNLNGNSNTSLRRSDLSIFASGELQNNRVILAFLSGTQLVALNYHPASSVADGSITTAKLADDAVTNAKLADDAVDTEQIAEDAVTGDEINAGAIISAHIFQDAVTSSKIATNAVETNKIADDAVTLAKMAGGTAEKFIGYDADGNPTELDEPSGDGEDGADGRFRIILYQNKTGTAPAAPTNITYTFSTEALANLGSWSQTRTAPSSGETTYEIIGTVDPDTTDTSVTLSFNTPVALITGGELDPPNQRSESIKFQAVTTNVQYGTNATPLTAITTDPIVVEYGSGVAEIITATEAITGGGTAIEIAKAGIYLVSYSSVIQLQDASGRVVPGIDFYEEDDTVGTDTPIGTIEGHYTRNQSVGDHRFEVTGRIIVDADNTSIKVVPISIEQHGVTNTPYQIDANSILYIERLGGDATGGGTLLTEAQITDEASTTAGLISGQRAKQAVDAFGISEADVEQITSEHIRHVIRRRVIITAGVLQVGDVRFDSTSIEINIHNDTADGWFGDLPVGAEIRIHGLSSGARSQYTLDSVTESGDDATLTVTRDSHSGIFTNHETVVLTFDQEHDPQSDWTESDENRPAYIQNKPTTFNNPRSFYYGRGGPSAEIQTSRTGPVVNDIGNSTGARESFRFKTTADETDFGGSTTLATWTNESDESDGDPLGVFGKDDSIFELPAGTYDITFVLRSVAEDTGGDAVVFLAKVESGVDDILLADAPGETAGAITDFMTTFEFHYKSLRLASGDKFYIGGQGLNASHNGAYWLLFERLA